MDNDARRSPLLFEFFKHMSTLDAAALAAVATLGQIVNLGLGLMLIGLVGFGWSLIAAVYGMFNIMGIYGAERTPEVEWLFRLVKRIAVRGLPESEADYYAVVAAATCAFSFLLTLLMITGVVVVVHVVHSVDIFVGAPPTGS